MASNLKRIAEEDAKLEMTPMIDVTFLLLIFFMCTLKFKTLEGKLAAYLPKDVGVNPMDAEPIEKIAIIVRVRNEGIKMNAAGTGPWDGKEKSRFTWQGRVIEYSVNQLTTQSLPQLESRLRELHLAQPENTATLDPRTNVNYEDVVGALDAALNAGFTSITFIGDRSGKP